MLPTSAMMRTTVKTKNIATCSSGRPEIGSGVGSYASGSVTHDLGRTLVGVAGEARPRFGQRGCSLTCLHAADVRDETACLSVTNVDVLDLGLIENSRDCRL